MSDALESHITIDDFAKVEVTVSRNELNTRLLDDPLFPGSGGVVAP